MEIPKPEQFTRKFIYRDNSTEDKRIVFECEAADILEADKQYKETTGKDVSKQSHIGCSFEKHQ